MDTFSDKHETNYLHIPQVRFGGDVGLQPRSEGSAQYIAKYTEHQRDRDQHEAPAGGTSSLERHPSKGCREKRRGEQVGPTARVDSQSAFSGAQARQGFIQRRADIFGTKIAKDEETRWIGMPGHRNFVRTCQHVERGMLERVIAPSFQDEREIEYHNFIIALKPLIDSLHE